MQNYIATPKRHCKAVIDINTKTAQTLEQNSREVARACQAANSRFNASIDNNTNTASGTTTATTSTTFTA
ncbi:MAG: hypothetical protein ACTHKJ_11410 [Candidatus Nitrosocosmicus sp.]